MVRSYRLSRTCRTCTISNMILNIMCLIWFEQVLVLSDKNNSVEDTVILQQRGSRPDSAGQSTTLDQAEISQQLWDGSAQTIVHTVMVLRAYIIMTFGILWLFLQRHHQVNICDFDRNVSTTVGWIVMKFGSHVHVPIRMNCSKLWWSLHFL